MKHFKSIEVRSKDDKEDFSKFTAFLNCISSDGVKWELQGQGRTPGEAANAAWDIFVLSEWNWEDYGREIREQEGLEDYLLRAGDQP